MLSSQPKSFKGGPCEFINLLSCVYLAEYIIHSGTAFTLLIQGQLFFLWIGPDIIILCISSLEANKHFLDFFSIRHLSGRPFSHLKNRQNMITEHDLVLNGSTGVSNAINKKEIGSTPFPSHDRSRLSEHLYVA